VSNGAGTRERHRCFRNFPDMVMTARLKGDAPSAAALGATAANKQQEVLVVYSTVDAPRVGYVDFRGDGRELAPAQSDATPARRAGVPRTYDTGKRRFTILNHYANAQSATHFVKAPLAPDRRPALLMSVAGIAEPVIIPWKSYVPVADDARRAMLLSYGPRFVDLPFSIHLKDFRKMDYPGTEMAMAYESDVTITTPGKGESSHLIRMNTPYAAYPWKVYLSVFQGDATSIFSVMRDPGLKHTYLGPMVLCVGIFLTFFARSFSWGTRASLPRTSANHPRPPPSHTRRAPMLRTLLFLLPALLLLCPPSPARAADARSTDWMNDLGAFATQDGGRIMPLETFARRSPRTSPGASTGPSDAGPQHTRGASRCTSSANCGSRATRCSANRSWGW
jgi:hypothetical protein